MVEPYYVLSWDFNRKTTEYYDIMPYLMRTFKEEKERGHYVFFKDGEPETFEMFKEFILSATRYQFWARCEYEIVVTGFPVQDHSVKLDIFDQIKHNIDVVTHHFMKQLKLKHYETNN